MIEDGIEGDGDVNPLGIGWKQRGYYLMVALAAGEDFALTDNLQHLWGEKWLRMVCDSDDVELHRLVGI